MDEIVSANTICDSMYFIEHGAVSVITASGVAVSRLRDGDCFGEMALVTDERRSATVIATSFCDIYRLEKKDFEEAIQGYPEIYDAISELAQKRARSNRRTNADNAASKKLPEAQIKQTEVLIGPL